MTGSQRLTAQAQTDRLAIASALLAALALIALLFTFRGLVFVTLPLSAAAVLLGAWRSVGAESPTYRILAVFGLVVGLLVLLASIGALVANMNVSDGYGVYDIQP
jgi:energy-coupling factor transporter transmembrane protein EcfT